MLSRHRQPKRAHACRKFQILCACISRLMYSACRSARATMVRVGLAAPAVVMALPSEINRFLMSCVCPQALVTPSLAALSVPADQRVDAPAGDDFAR